MWAFLVFGLLQVDCAVFCPCECIVVFGFECSGFPEELACVWREVLLSVNSCIFVLIVFFEVAGGDVLF